jgi:predicted ester cyclase
MTNKDIVKRYATELWDQRNLGIIEELFTENTLISSPFRVTQGAAAMRDIAERWLEAFPDLECTWEDWIAEGDKVVSRWHAVGTHLGSFFDTSPTHREVHYSGVTTYAVKDGKIAAYWAMVDVHSIQKQLQDLEIVTEVATE